MKRRIDVLAGAKKARHISHWLMILKPGQCMEFEPKAVGIKAETIQSYVEAISATGNRQYKVINGRCRDPRQRDFSQPVGVRYLGDKT